MQIRAKRNGPDREIFFNKQRKREKRMKKFDIEFETNLQLEQVHFEWRKTNLEAQMKKLAIKRHLREVERELGTRKV